MNVTAVGPSRVILDTDVFSEIATQRPRAESFSTALVGEIPVLTFASVGEIYYGMHKGNWGANRVARIEAKINACLRLPYDDNLPKMWGELRKIAANNGHPLVQSANNTDLWIATCAVYYDIPLLTANVRHFRDLVPNLHLVDGSPRAEDDDGRRTAEGAPAGS